MTIFKRLFSILMLFVFMGNMDVHATAAEEISEDNAVVHTTAAEEISEGRATANKAFPVKEEPYTHNEIWDTISPHLHKDVVPTYELALSLMFYASRPPIHPNTYIVGGWQCFYGKILESNKGTSVVLDQETALFSVLSFHKNAPFWKIKSDVVRALYARLDDFAPCPNCVAMHKNTFFAS